MKYRTLGKTKLIKEENEGRKTVDTNFKVCAIPNAKWAPTLDGMMRGVLGEFNGYFLK